MALSIPYLLSIITFLPCGAVVVMLVPGDGAKKWLALATTLITFVVSLLLDQLAGGQAGMQFVEDAVWFAPLGIRYALGVDGISLFLVLLTTFLMPIAVTSASSTWTRRSARTWRSCCCSKRPRSASSWRWTWCSSSSFRGEPHPHVLPHRRMGRQEPRLCAAVKFFPHTFAGSALMVVAILIVYYSTGTFDIAKLQSTVILPAVQTWAFPAFAPWPSPSRRRSSLPHRGCPTPT